MLGGQTKFHVLTKNDSSFLCKKTVAKLRPFFVFGYFIHFALSFSSMLTGTVS